VDLPLSAPVIENFGTPVEPNTETYINVFPSITSAEESIRSHPLVNTKIFNLKFRMKMLTHFLCTYLQSKRLCYFSDEFLLKYYNYYTEINCINECLANVTFDICGCRDYYMPS